MYKPNPSDITMFDIETIPKVRYKRIGSWYPRGINGKHKTEAKYTGEINILIPSLFTNDNLKKYGVEIYTHCSFPQGFSIGGKYIIQNLTADNRMHVLIRYCNKITIIQAPLLSDARFVESNNDEDCDEIVLTYSPRAEKDNYANMRLSINRKTKELNRIFLNKHI